MRPTALLVLALFGTTLMACHDTESGEHATSDGGSAGTENTGGTQTGGVENGGVENGGVENGGVENGGAGGAENGGAGGAENGGAGGASCPPSMPAGPCTDEGLTCDYSYALDCPPGCSGGAVHVFSCLDGEWEDVRHTAGVPQCHCPGAGGAGGAAGAGGNQRDATAGSHAGGGGAGGESS